MAGAIGLSVTDLRRMSLWEFAHFYEGWRQANGVDDTAKAQAPSEDEFDDFLNGTYE